MKQTERSRAVALLAALLAVVVALTLVWDDPAEARKKKKKKRYTTVTVFVDEIVFASNQSIVPGDPLTTDMEIFIIKPDGTGLKQLTVNTKLDDGPTMSPDGAKIAYSHEFAPGDRDILVMNRDGSNTAFLTTSLDAEWTPDWSPDGSKIAYTVGTGSTSEIFVMNADGSGKANLNPNPNQPDFRPVFSPNGTMVAFTSFYGGGTDFEILQTPFRPEGGSTVRLPVTTPDNTTDDYRPEYSPDGSKIYYDSAGASTLNPEGDFEVMATSLDGSGTTTNLTNNTTDDLRPSVRRPGTWLVYEKLSSATLPTDSKNSPRFPGTYTSTPFIMDANGNLLGAINIDGSKTNQSPDWGGYWISYRVRR